MASEASYYIKGLLLYIDLYESGTPLVRLVLYGLQLIPSTLINIKSLFLKDAVFLYSNNYSLLLSLGNCTN